MMAKNKVTKSLYPINHTNPKQRPINKKKIKHKTNDDRGVGSSKRVKRG